MAKLNDRQHAVVSRCIDDIIGKDPEMSLAAMNAVCKNVTGITVASPIFRGMIDEKYVRVGRFLDKELAEKYDSRFFNTALIPGGDNRRKLENNKRIGRIFLTPRVNLTSTEMIILDHAVEQLAEKRYRARKRNEEIQY